jgi:apolipoprotein N-acyltransferase
LSKVKSSPYYLLILSLLTGILLSAGWPMSPMAFLLFLAWVPLLRVEAHIAARPDVKRPGLLFFSYAYIAMFTWNLLTTWWVSNSTLVGGVFAMLANAALMTVPLVLFRWTRRATTSKFGYVAFLFYWIGFEYIHLSWDLSWPWLTLGNSFSKFTSWVQWYEYTGVLGGTLWILLANLAVYYAYKLYKANNAGAARTGSYISVGFIVLAPILYSYYMYNSWVEKGQDKEFVVIQPNIDPFTQKFAGSEDYIPVDQQIAHFIRLSESKITPQTSYVAWPETAIDGVLNEHKIEYETEIQQIRDFLDRHPHVALVTGITSYNIYKDKTIATATARYREGLGYYDVFNTAMFMQSGRPAEFYHKSKLVPGVEIMPYMHIFSFLSNLVIDLGGTSGGYGRQDDRAVFYNNDSVGVAPVICYESIYGDFVTGYIRRGADFIMIITNDGWWGNTPGHRQHLAYGALRAIETRRSIARSANTGISGYINQRGDILQPTAYWVEDVVQGTIKANDEITFYVKHGDYLGRTAALIAPFLLLSIFVKRRISFKKSGKKQAVTAGFKR